MIRDSDSLLSPLSDNDIAMLLPYTNYSLRNSPLANYLPHHHIIRLQGKTFKNAISSDRTFSRVLSKISKSSTKSRKLIVYNLT